MYWFKVILGSRRYTTERVVRVQATDATEACRVALCKHKRMRYASARKVV